MPAKEAFRCFRGFRCFRDSVGGPWNRDFVDFVEIVLSGGYRETVEIVDFVVFGGYRETVEIVDFVGFGGYREIVISLISLGTLRVRICSL